MSVDPIGVTIVIFAFIVGTHATRTTIRIYLELDTEFFKYATYACISLVLMISGYIFPAILSSENYSVIASTGQVFLASFGILALAFLIAASDNVKENPNEWIVSGGFLLAGLLIATRFRPDEYALIWTGTRWIQQYGPLVIVLSVLIFLYLTAVLGNVVYRVWSRIRRSEVYKTESRVLFIGFAVLLGFYGIFMIINNSLSTPISSSSVGYYLFLFILSGVAGLVARLLRLYPTIFFASTADLLEIQFVSKATQNTIYRFLFLPENPDTDSLSISIAHESIKHVFHDALDKTGEVKSIKVEENEVLACEGDNLYGLLVTKAGSDLHRRLLIKSLRHFEDTESILQYYEGDEFDSIIRNYFQFAIPTAEECNQKVEGVR